MKTLISSLQEYCESYLPMHMPGHKRNVQLAAYLKKLGAGIDITEVQGFDNLQNPEGVLKKSMENAQEYFNAKRSFYLVNGSTVGILAGIYALTKENDNVLLARNSHISIFHAAILRKLNINFAEPCYIPEYNIAGSITPTDIKRALEQNPSISLVVVTSPNYEGVISDIKGIADVAHSFGAKLLVDEAHGAHLYRNGFFTGGAVNSGADIVVQSLHKTLPSVTQTAIAHVQNEKYAESFARWLNAFQTSSPSYMLMSSIDGCINFLCAEGDNQYKKWEEAIKSFDSYIEPLKKLRVFCHGGNTAPSSVFLYDKSKILISTANSDISGYDLFSALRNEFRIEAEMASDSLCLCMTGMGDTKESLLKLAHALNKIDEKIKLREYAVKQTALPQIKMRLPIAEAANSACEELDLKKAKGKLCAETLYAYPPGVPIAVPGSIITDETISYILAAKNTGLKIQRSRSKNCDNIAVCV